MPRENGVITLNHRLFVPARFTCFLLEFQRIAEKCLPALRGIAGYEFWRFPFHSPHHHRHQAKSSGSAHAAAAKAGVQTKTTANKKQRRNTSITQNADVGAEGSAAAAAVAAKPKKRKDRVRAATAARRTAARAEEGAEQGKTPLAPMHTTPATDEVATPGTAGLVRASSSGEAGGPGPPVRRDFPQATPVWEIADDALLAAAGDSLDPWILWNLSRMSRLTSTAVAEVFDSQYELGETIGEGTSAIVRTVRRRVDGAALACKTYRSNSKSSYIFQDIWEVRFRHAALGAHRKFAG